ncbi:MAG: TetR/AcrR family transcriptional regulator [Deltaproteobacteria bacterium]|nr:TetR/AcrR family transcriptional regulator [Deltaproteobacteria bacterium]
MPYPPEHKPRTHARIVEVAARMFREDGMQATGIDRLMAEAGLTRGGFYAHFPSKAALFAEALRHAFGEARENLLAKGLDRLSGRDWVLGATRRYLARDHEEAPGLGCAIPTLGAEVARAPSEVREAFADEVDKILDGLVTRSGADRGEAMALLATWVGAITLARALPDEAQADAVLDAARAHIAASFARSEPEAPVSPDAS